MKHIKTKNIFESISEDHLIIEIEDRLMELEDIGYDINVAPEDFSDVDEYFDNMGYTIYIHKKENFRYLDIETYLDHLISFMKSEEYGFKVKRSGAMLRNALTTSVIIQFYQL